MIDLIKEIEKKKTYYDTDFVSCEFNDGWNNALDVCLKLLTQYNIITAPKTIKLSEIVSKLKEFECFCTDYKVYRERKENEIVIECCHYSFIECLHGENIIIKNNKISNIEAPKNEYFKWLYELWIAGTKIIDDLEGND